jgi:hypothetical protein
MIHILDSSFTNGKSGRVADFSDPASHQSLKWSRGADDK